MSRCYRVPHFERLMLVDGKPAFTKAQGQSIKTGQAVLLDQSSQAVTNEITTIIQQIQPTESLNVCTKGFIGFVGEFHVNLRSRSASRLRHELR